MFCLASDTTVKSPVLLLSFHFLRGTGIGSKVKNANWIGAAENMLHDSDVIIFDFGVDV